jgi:uncharacterized protein (TIGR00369 family)
VADAFEPRDPGFAERVRESFARQRFMSTLGARLVSIAAGAVDVELPFADSLVQQHGYLHAGAVAAAMDSACGYAALTLLDEDAAVLTVEFKVDLLEPAAGERVVARGRVLRAGRTLTVCRAEAAALDGGVERHVASMSATIMAVRDRGAVRG